ncbi:MAG: hypothetical protein ACOH5I_19425 [Oligoflexus sp.]
MNLVIILVIVGFFWVKTRTRLDPLNQIEQRIQQDFIRLQVEPSWLVQTEVDRHSTEPSGFQEFYFAALKQCLLQGQSLSKSLEALARVIRVINELQRKAHSLRETFLVKLGFQMLTVIIVRLILGDFWLRSWLELGLILGLAIALVGIWLLFERLLPRVQLASWQEFQWWLVLLMSAGERYSESCPGIADMLRMEKKNGIGRRDARVARIVQHLEDICHEDELRRERFAETLVVFELLAGGLIVSCLLALPVSKILQLG